ncbi:MAG: hypothetical protein ACRDJL_11220, partial [Actinomycetota bacterium]
MAWLTRLDEEQIEQALDGQYAGEDPSLEDLAAFARDAKASFGAVPAESTRRAHLTAMVEAAANLERQTIRPTERTVSVGLLRRVKPVLSSLFASLTAKLAMAGVALAATGGLAATGSLPAPAQEALAKAGEKVGIELPRAD